MKICSFPGCGGVVKGRGLCDSHYCQFKRGKELKPIGHNRRRGTVCTINGDVSVAHILVGTDGLYEECLIDTESSDMVSKFTWRISPSGYAVSGKSRRVGMHRMILGLESGDKQIVDHINRNKLDNRRSNLRIVSDLENSWNVGFVSNNTSGFKGVTRDDKRWRAQMGSGTGGSPVYLGKFDTPEEAALAYDSAIVFHRGEFAVTNASLGLL